MAFLYSNLHTLTYLLVLFDLDTVGLAAVLVVLTPSWLVLDPCPGFLLPPAVGLEMVFLLVLEDVVPRVPDDLSGVVLDPVAVLGVDVLEIIH